MHHWVVILQECACEAFSSVAVKVGDLDNEVFLALYRVHVVFSC